jgi:hypothetical protein
MAFKINNKHRVNIVREARKLIKQERPDYDSLPSGKRETILDEYLSKVCESKGHTLSEFYFADGQTLNKILGN